MSLLVIADRVVLGAGPAGIGAGLVTGRLMSKGLTNRMATLVGGITAAVGFMCLAVGHDATGLLGFLPGLVLVGAGVVIACVPFGNLILLEAPPEHLGPVSSSRTTVGQFFYTIGFSISAVTIDRLTTGGVASRTMLSVMTRDQLPAACWSSQSSRRPARITAKGPG